MGLNFWIVIFIVIAALCAGLWFARRRSRRKGGRVATLPPQWEAILSKTFLFYDWLPDSEFDELARLMPRFLGAKRFEGCDGLTVTDEMRVAIAAHACLLLLGKTQPFYPDLDTVLIYPGSFVAPSHWDLGSGQTAPVSEVRDGESWQQGLLIFAWSEFMQDVEEGLDRNVLIHEFAHQLDRGASHGELILREYERLRNKLKRRKRTALDDYAAESPDEFFAVATETFFLNPAGLQAESAELYEFLNGFYGVSPLTWGIPGIAES